MEEAPLCLSIVIYMKVNGGMTNATDEEPASWPMGVGMTVSGRKTLGPVSVSFAGLLHATEMVVTPMLDSGRTARGMVQVRGAFIKETSI